MRRSSSTICKGVSLLLVALFTGCASVQPHDGVLASPSASAMAKPLTTGSDAARLAKQKMLSPLNLTSLEKRLRETEAIGDLSKIELKSQVDELLGRFRAFHHGTLKTTLTELRRPYDELVLKVLSLLQDHDPPLAAAIQASREAIWHILADPAKFAAI